MLVHFCLLLFLPSAQAHCARMRAGFSCLSCTGLNLPLLLIQVLNDQGGSRCRSQGDRHRACGTGTCVTPGVTSSWWRQEGVRELLGVVFALEQPSEQSCFSAAHGSPVQPIPLPTIPKEPIEPPAALCSTPTLVPLQLKPLPAMGCTDSRLKGCQPMLLQQVGPAGEEELRRVLTAPRAGSFLLSAAGKMLLLAKCDKSLPPASPGLGWAGKPGLVCTRDEGTLQKALFRM